MTREVFIMSQNVIRYKVNGKDVAAPRGRMLLPELLDMGIEIPTLCHMDEISPYGACRLCLVEIVRKGRSNITTSCNYAIAEEGIEVLTDTDRVKRLRRMVMELHWARNPESDVIERMARKMGIEKPRFPLDEGNGKCILCGICVRVCDEVVGVHALTFSGRGVHREIGTPFDEPSSTCIGCGACYWSCPTNAIEMKEKGGVREIWGKKFDMERCSVCGEYFAPKYQLEYLAKTFKTPIKELRVCMTCRGK